MTFLIRFLLFLSFGLVLLGAYAVLAPRLATFFGGLR